MTRFILVHPLICVIFLIIWAGLSFLLHRYYKKHTVIIGLHVVGLILLVCQFLSLASEVPFLFRAAQLYFLPALQISVLPFSRLFYLIFGQVNIVQGYCTSLLFMVAASYLGCILRKILTKSK